MSPSYSAPTVGADSAIDLREAAPRPSPLSVSPFQSPAHLWQRVAQIGIGHTLYAGFNWLFDNVLYVWVVYTLGVLKGGALMMAASGVQCAVLLVVYQRMRIDWVGVGLVTEMRTKPQRTRIARLLARASDFHPAAIFTLLCVLQDPFVTTAWLKRGSFDRLTRRDWSIFCAAVVVANVYWIFVASLLGRLVASLWRLASTVWS